MVLQMAIIYESTEQIILEIRKLMLEEKISQRQIADSLGITPQGFTKLINKKNFSFEDAKKILTAMGYRLICNFEKKLRPFIGLFSSPMKKAPDYSDAFPSSINCFIIMLNCAAWLTPAFSHANANSSTNSFFNLYDFDTQPAFASYFLVAIVWGFGLPTGIIYPSFSNKQSIPILQYRL